MTDRHRDGDDKLLLIGIGAQRSGTTWLATYFYHHPEVFMPLLKELHFFNRDIADADGTNADEIMLRRLQARAQRSSVPTLAQDPQAARWLVELANRMMMIHDPRTTCASSCRKRGTCG
jgi:hypothetical protein